MIELPKTSQGLTPIIRGDLCNELICICEDNDIDWNGLYILGSYIYGVPDPADIDILISADRCEMAVSSEESLTTRPEGITELQNQVCERINSKIELKLVRNWESPECDLGFMIPYYDILSGVYVHKSPESVHPFHYRWSIKAKEFQCYMRDKKTRALNLLF